MAQTWVETSMLHVMAERRVAARLSQGGLAEAVNGAGAGSGLRWTRATVAALENGRRVSLRIEEIAALCKVFGLTLQEWLALADMPADQQEHLFGLTGDNEHV